MSQQPSTRPYGRGADADFEQRPGVPKVRTPPTVVPGAHLQIERQSVPRRSPTHRNTIERMTPVFGAQQLPRGLAGLMRRFAYQLPETQARHWLLLVAADRVDVLTHRFGRLTKGALTLTAALAVGWFVPRLLRA
jgi:hypothetical protein